MENYFETYGNFPKSFEVPDIDWQKANDEVKSVKIQNETTKTTLQYFQIANTTIYLALFIGKKTNQSVRFLFPNADFLNNLESWETQALTKM